MVVVVKSPVLQPSRKVILQEYLFNLYITNEMS